MEGEVVVSMIYVLLSSKNWKGEDQVHFILSRLRNVAPTGPFTLRQRSGRCDLPRSQILRRAGRLRTFKNWPCSPVSPRGCVAASHTFLIDLKMGTMIEDAVGSSYHSQSAERDLPAVSGLCAAEARRCRLVHSTSEMPETSSPYMAAGCRPHS